MDRWRVRTELPNGGVSSPRTRSLVSLALAFVVTSAGLLVGPSGAFAAAANDDFDAASVISSLPFSTSVDTTGATVQAGEPQFCSTVDDTVWYAITPTADATVVARASGGWPPAQLSMYRQDGSGFAGLTFLGCQDWSTESVVEHMQAGATYYVQASTLFFGRQLDISIEEVQVPGNDAFADASPISMVPLDDVPNLLGASAEPGEPTGCVGTGQKTVWYAFTPSATGSYAIDRSGGSGYLPIAVYSGASLSALSQVACAGYSTAIFHAEAGRTYYLQLGHGYGSGGPVQLSVRDAPPATASFYHYPSDPSIFDTVSFYDSSSDPAGVASWAWAFGDGATATGSSASHRYATDNDYTAKLAIATTDGRTATATHGVHVRTHDVAITKLTVPQASRVGQTRQLTVGITNTRYAENVQVALLRSVPGGGFEEVGQVTQSVPVRSGGRTTSFSINYTFAAADATLGKATFQAVATILGARDANAADNTIVALPTKVTQ
jgi:PKD repeat protein